MEALQIICNYRKKSLLSKAGFKAIGISSGIESNERKEIEARASEEILKIEYDFKEYISFYKLSSGRYFICKITKDFLHGFIAKEGIFDFYPIKLFNSENFINDILDFNIKKFGIIELPIINEFKLNDNLEFDYISEFIKGKNGITLSEMIDVLLLYSSDKKFLIINDSIGNIPYWIAGLQMVFPIDMAHQISFTTNGSIYVNNQYAVVASRELNLDDLTHNIRERSYFFDLNNYIKNSTQLNYKFNRVMDCDYLISKESTYSFHEFLDKFSCRSINKEVKYIYNFYTIINLGIGDMKDEELINAIKFCDEFLIQEYDEEIIGKMGSIFDTISREININTFVVILEFIFKRISGIKNLILVDKVYTLLFNCMDNIIFEYDNNEKNNIDDFYDYLVGISGERAEGLRRFFINSENVDYITYRLIEKGKQDDYNTYFKIIMENLVTLNCTWSDVNANEKYKQFFVLCVIKTCSDLNYVEEILSRLLNDEEIFFNILSLYYDNWIGSEKNIVFANIFARIVKSIENEKMINIRRKIYAAYGGDFLFNEYNIGLNLSQNKGLYFNEYYKYVILEVPDYGKNYYSSVIKEYININKESMIKQDYINIIYSIYNSKYEVELPVLRELVQEIERNMDIKRQEIEDEKILHILNRMKKEKDIQTIPDITSYINFGMVLENYYDEKEYYTMKDILNNMIKVENLNKEQYNQYLTWCIPKIIYFVKSSEDHKAVAYKFKMLNMDKEYFNVYLRGIKELINTDTQMGYSILLSFIVYFFFYLEPQYRYMEEEDLLNGVFDNMLENILSLPKSEISKIDKDVKEEFINEGLSIPIQWTELYNKIQ